MADMAFSNPGLAMSILFQATTGRPIVLSRGFNDTWALQCNGEHFIQDPGDKQEVAAVEKVINELAGLGLLRAEGWQGANRPLYLTEEGYTFCQQVIQSVNKR